MNRCPFCKLSLAMNEASRLVCSGCEDPLPGSADGGFTAGNVASRILAEPVELESIEGVAGGYCAMNREPELRVTARQARLAGRLNGGAKLARID